MIDVAVNGYGTIGKRVADAVAAQSDMRVVGVAKTSPNHEARQAVERGYPLYGAVEDRLELFDDAGIPLEGHVDGMLGDAEVVVDATPSGIGAQNRELYAEHDVKALYQGGEDADVAERSFNAAANYGACRGADALRVVSCNTTGLLRLLHPLERDHGVGSVQATLVRRGGDPAQHGRGPINDVLPNPVELPSHHGPDVKTVMPDLDIFTAGFKVPATLMHVHHVAAEVAADRDAVLDTLEGEDRVLFVSAEDGVASTAAVKEMMLDRGRPRGDCWENAVWRDSVTVEDGVLHLFQAIHQESDVVPENVDAIRAAVDAADRDESRRATDEALGIPLA